MPWSNTRTYHLLSPQHRRSYKSSTCFKCRATCVALCRHKYTLRYTICPIKPSKILSDIAGVLMCLNCFHALSHLFVSLVFCTLFNLFFFLSEDKITASVANPVCLHFPQGCSLVFKWPLCKRTLTGWLHVVIQPECWCPHIHTRPHTLSAAQTLETTLRTHNKYSTLEPEHLHWHQSLLLPLQTWGTASAVHFVILQLFKDHLLNKVKELDITWFHTDELWVDSSKRGLECDLERIKKYCIIQYSGVHLEKHQGHCS